MKLRCKIIVSCIIIAASCNDQKNTNPIVKSNKITDTVIKDIPLGKNGKPYAYYRIKGNVEEKLGLTSLESGFDSLQIRLWYGYASNDSSQLVILKNNNHKWSAELFTLEYQFDSETDTIKSINKSSIIRDPTSGWANFSDRLFDLQIITLPDDEKITHYPDLMDGDGIIVELATRKFYRIYSYKEPNYVYNREKIKEAYSITLILDLIEEEFNFKRLRKF